MNKESFSESFHSNEATPTPEITADTFEESIQKNPQLQACFNTLKKETDVIRIPILLQPLVYHKMGFDLMDHETAKAFRTMYDSVAEDGVLVKEHIAKYLTREDVMDAITYTTQVFETWLTTHPPQETTVH